MSKPGLWYTLDEHRNPVQADAGAWEAMRRRGETFLRRDDGVVDDLEVSTVFLGLDHRYYRCDGPPILWETLVFGPEDHPWTHHMERYSSEADAIAGHERIVAAIKAGEHPHE